jgi:tetratricopeptide (TPR) repeat protein
VELPGPAGEALIRAQDDYAMALKQFPDLAGNHAALAWLDLQRQRPAPADAALDAAIRLDPRLARAWVIKGVIAARENRFDEAISLWRKAQALDRGYPNIDRLIAEAEKRKR